MSEMFKLEFYVPESHLDEVKKAVLAAGGGVIGNYDSCAWQTRGEGQFRPLPGSDPHIGETGQVETVVEYKVELVCAPDKIKAAIEALKSSHPYETPAYQYWKVNGETA